MRRLIAATIGLGLYAGAAAAQENAKWLKQLVNWNTVKTRADQRLLQAFDRNIAAMQHDRSLPPETRNRHVSALRGQKILFEKSQTLPESDQMLPATIDYLHALHQAATPLRIQFDHALEQAVGSGAAFDTIAAAKAQWQSALPGRDELAAQTHFHGTRTFRKGRTVDFHLHIHAFEDESFSGTIWQDVHSVSGKAGWQVEGKREGNQFLLTTTKMLHGNSRKPEFRGYIIGRRIVMTLTHLNGKPVEPGDLASLWKK